MPPAIFICDELLHTTSLLLVTECITLQNSDAKLFATAVAVKHGVGGSRFREELRFSVKILGRTPLKSSGLKYLKQTLVPSFTEKFGLKCLLTAWSHCLPRLMLSGK